MSAATEVYMTVHIECDFRDDQEAEDRFELYFGRSCGDPFWLNADELADFRDCLSEALDAKESADTQIKVGANVR